MGQLLKRFSLMITAASAALMAGALPLWASQKQTIKAHSISASVAALANYFPDPVRRHRQGGFLIMSDALARVVSNTANVLCAAETRFFVVMKRGGFDVHRVHRPLICLLFEDKRPFVRYAQAADGQNMSWSGGYYSSRTNRIALYEHAWMPQLGSSGHARKSNADDVRGPIRADDHNQWSESGVARTIHEATHLLAFNSGLQKRGVMYPFWVSEGVATSFETENIARPFGPGTLNRVRGRGLVRAWRQGKLIKLATFVTMTHLSTGNPARVASAYAEAWGWFSFLYAKHRADLARYMKRMARDRIGWQSKKMLRNQFCRVFGPTKNLALGWRQWLTMLSRQVDASR